MALDEDPAYARRWWIVGAVLIGTWVGTLGNSMMSVALPSMMEQYAVGVNLGVWVVSVYVLLVAVLMPIFGWLGDRYGYRRILVLGLAGQAVFSVGSALAPSFGVLILFRALQGICNATTLPSVMGVISEVFPGGERGGAMGVWAAVNGAAHGLGPVISGYLVQVFHWPATFWLLAATAAAGVVLVYAWVPSDRKHEERPFDLLGAGALTLAMLTLMFTLSRGSDLGWGSWISVGLWLTFAALMAAFVVAERRVATPFVELRLFANKLYTLIVAVSSAQFFCLMGLPILLSLYLIRFRGLPSGIAGWLIAPLASTLAVSSPLAGRIADRLGYRNAMVAGIAIVALGSGSLAFWQADTPPWLVVVTLIVIGLGMGFVQSPSATGVTLVVHKAELGVALGIFNMLRFISGTLAATVFGILLEAVSPSSADPMLAYHLSFYLLAAVAALGTLLAFSMPRPRVAAAVAGD